MTYCKHKPVFCECQPDEGVPCPYQPATLRERVLAMADEHDKRHGPMRQHELALAVAAMVAEECARECEKQSTAGEFNSREWNKARDCAAAIRARGDTL